MPKVVPLTASPDGAVCLCVQDKTNLLIFSTIKHIIHFDHEITAVAIRNNEFIIALNTNEIIIIPKDQEKQNLRYQLQKYDSPIVSLAGSEHDSPRLLVGFADGTLSYFDGNNTWYYWSAHAAPIDNVKFIEKGQKIISCSTNDKAAKKWALITENTLV